MQLKPRDPALNMLMLSVETAAPYNIMHFDRWCEANWTYLEERGIREVREHARRRVPFDPLWLQEQFESAIGLIAGGRDIPTTRRYGSVDTHKKTP